jgi:hypothetical protein
MRTATATTEQGTVTDAKGERREARRNTRPDGSQVVIYASTSRRVAPAVAATFVPDAEVAQPGQLEPAELEQHLAQLDELLDSDGAKALEHEVAHAQADEAHERQMAEQADRAEQARISQQRAAQRADRRTAAPAAPVKHRMAWFDYIDGAKVPHSPERKRRLGDVISVQCTCGEASPTATRREIDGWVAEHKRGLRTAA